MIVDGEQRAVSLQICFLFFREIVVTKVIGVGVGISTYKELWDRQFRR